MRPLPQGFEWYDTMTTTLLSNVTFEGYRRGSPYTDSPGNYWEAQAPSAFRMLSHSDQFKPGGTTAAVQCVHVSHMLHQQQLAALA